MKIKFWGTRGSIPVPGKDTIIYGGNTPCVQINTKQNRMIILDAGTGIRELGKFLLHQNKISNISLLISHTHWDHIHGIPFFPPLFSENYDVEIYSNSVNGINSEKIIDSQMNTDFFPVDKHVFSAKLKYNSIDADSTYTIAGIQVDTLKVNHSKGTLAFKLTEDGSSLVYMTDNEIKYDNKTLSNLESIYRLNKDLVDFCKNCDYLIHDSMYMLEDFNEKIGWGHSNNISSAYFSMAANVKNLILFHYAPDYNDNNVEKMFIETKQLFQGKKPLINCIAAKEGLEIEI